jgi:hypothetical protein
LSYKPFGGQPTAKRRGGEQHGCVSGASALPVHRVARSETVEQQKTAARGKLRCMERRDALMPGAKSAARSDNLPQ